ncbi:MAG: extracellular solute-binding protein [Clostridia bacterium]|nr:extracellular solute-binding protein [Clostridia bacterium]
MIKNCKRLICLIIAFALVFSLIGCKNNTGDLSSNDVEYIVEEEYVYVDGENNNINNSNNISANTSDDGSTNNNSNGSSYVPFATDPSEFKGTTVKFAVTSDPMESEKGPVIESFENKYNIKIEPVIIKGDFVTELTGLIANGNSPDVVRSSGDFPLSLCYLQSLDTAKIDYNDSIWEQAMFNLTTFGGSPYLCSTVGNVYTEIDIVVYRKDILEQAGCKTPEQYDKEGNWNMDAFFEIGRTCAEKVSGVQGCSFVNIDSALHMTGNSVFKYENGMYSNGINDSIMDVLSKLSQVKAEGLISINATKGIVDGTIAITTHHSYALRKTGAFEDNKDVWSKLGYYYLPSYSESTKNVQTGIFRGWGIVKGSQNPVAAGIFLRHYLDPSNFDLVGMYISPEASNFFLRATTIDYNNWNPYFTYGRTNEEIAGIDFNNDIYSVINLDKTQIERKLSSINTKIDKGCDNLNKYVSQQIMSH